MPRLNEERQNKLEPKRMNTALKELRKLGFSPIQIDSTKLQFLDNKEMMVTYFPYSGWASGKGINDGRGFKKLINQLK